MAVTGDTLIDSVFDGRYRIIRKLGAGGMANVYLAEDQELGRRGAIKILDDRHAADDSFIERFRREAKNAGGSPVDQRSDVYSVGIVLYEMLTGTVPFTGDTPLEIAMKHLSEVPVPPSELRDDVPDDLDLVVLRALAKDPEDRYQTAEEMNADLARIQRGLSVSSETTDAATAVLAGAGISGAPTIIAPRPTQVAPPQAPPPAPPAGYYGYDGPPRRSRSIWPWLLVLLLLVGAGFAAWFAYGKIRDELNANKPVAVPYVLGLKKAQAVKKITDKDLKAKIIRGFSQIYPSGTVMNQSIAGGEKTDKGNTVLLTVSSGKPKTTVPDVRGKAESDAVAALTSAHLKVSVFHVYSSESPDTVTGQNPPAGSRVFWNTKVRINVSQGVRQIEIPNVVGQPYASARSTLLGAGLNATETLVDSNQPADTVVSQSPGRSEERRVGKECRSEWLAFQ